MARILVVDDEESHLGHARMQLEIDGHEVETSISGHAAIRALQEDTRHDIVIADLEINDGTDGIQIAMAAHRRGIGKIIVHSGRPGNVRLPKDLEGKVHIAQRIENMIIGLFELLTRKD